MIYVGRGLRACREFGGVEPALIDPKLPVDWDDPDVDGDLMSYWPSYSSIEPSSRAAYLEWLSTGRSDPNAYIGYVFLFFYGIERRLLQDAQDDPVSP